MGIWNAYVGFLESILRTLGNTVNSGAIAIIIFTIVVKTLLLPLTVKSIKSSKAMQELGPKIKEIQKKHGNDRQAASQEQMALYQAYGVNPAAGCLPMLIQLPIFFGVYSAIRAISFSGDPNFADGFLWVPDLAQADPWKLLPLLAGLFQFIQSRMMRPAKQTITDPQQKMMNTMMNFMPLTVVLFGWNFAAGPVIYWVTQALYSVFQQWIITGWGAFGEWFPWLPELPEHRRLGYAPARNIDDITVVAGEQKPKGRFQRWMQAQMEKAEEQRAAQQRQRDEAVKAITQKRTAPTPGTIARRADYQARVDAALRRAQDGASADADPAPIARTPRPTSSSANRTNRRRGRNPRQR